MNTNDTNELMQLLAHTTTTSELKVLDEKLSQDIRKISFSDYINEQIFLQDISPADLIAQAGIQRNYGYQILNGTKNPSKEKIISLCLALHLDVAQTQRALKIAQTAPLYPKIRRDAILLFAIQKKYSVQKTNELLDEMKEESLQ